MLIELAIALAKAKQKLRGKRQTLRTNLVDQFGPFCHRVPPLNEESRYVLRIDFDGMSGERKQNTFDQVSLSI